MTKYKPYRKAVNMDKEFYTVSIYVDGKPVEKPFELRSNKSLDSAFTVESYRSVLIKVTD